MKNIYLFLLLGLTLFLNSCGVFLQSTGMKNYKLKTQIDRSNINNYQYDFIYLTQLLDKGFPYIDSVFPQKTRDSLANIIIGNLSDKEVTNIDFIIQTRKYLSNFHNQHTSIRLKTEFKKVFPFYIHIYQNEWYLWNIETKYDSLLISKQIIKINDVEISNIEDQLIKFSFAENKINQQYDVRKFQFYNTPEYLKEIGLINTLNDSLKITFLDNSFIWINPINKENFKAFYIKPIDWEITKHQKKTYLYEMYSERNFAYLQYNSCHDSIDILDGITNYVKPWLQPCASWYVKRQFKKERPSKQISPYYNTEYPVFKDFIWELVDSCNKNNIGNLIIDLRNNSGGSLLLGKQLIYFLTNTTQVKDFKDYAYTSDIYKEYFYEEYNILRKMYGDNSVPYNELVLTSETNNLFLDIVDKESNYFIPKNRPVFQGKIYVLANYRTGSAAAMLTTLLQDNGIATVIGTSVGNNPTGATSWMPFKLPRTKANISIATTYKERPNENPEKIQVPDYWIEYSIRDLQNGVDSLFDKVMDLIEQNEE